MKEKLLSGEHIRQGVQAALTIALLGAAGYGLYEAHLASVAEYEKEVAACQVDPSKCLVLTPEPDYSIGIRW